MCDLVWREVVAVVSCVCLLLAEQASDVALLFKIPGQVGKGGGGGMVLEKSLPSPAKAASLHLD